MKIDLFDVEAWMTEYETNYRYNLAETCVASMSINDLLEFVENKKGVIDNLLNTKLDYGPIVGSQRLREGIARLYQNGDADNITISHGLSLIHIQMCIRDSHYTIETWQNFEKALENAESIYDGNVPQDEVDLAKEALEKAKNELLEKNKKELSVALEMRCV